MSEIRGDRRGPTFVAEFSDGVTTRMTVHCPKALDLPRAVRLARVAYVSRQNKTPPAIFRARFEAISITVLEEYDRATIAAAEQEKKS